jgi:riboflavin kinase/FMN adenylyltransferase
MRIFSSIQDLNLNCPSVITVGTFDGIHLGHLQVINRLKHEFLTSDCEELLITFHPHPKTVVGKLNNKSIKLLTPLNEKLRILDNVNLSAILVIPFTKKFSQTSYNDFVKKILVDQLNVRSMVIGYDHAFGKDREGHPEQLKIIADKLNFSVNVVEPYYHEGELVSSTRIRAYLAEGKVENANRLLGRQYSISGKIVRGQQRGGKIGFPTANLALTEREKLLPRNGVYAVDVLLRGNTYRGMMNIGYRPTFNFDPLTLETHLINFTGSIYGEVIEVKFIKFIRDEKKFSTIFELKNQLINDKKVCEKI